jgi:hypothetical protein
MTETDVPDFFKLKGDVAAVDPADLKSVCAFMREARTTARRNTAISIGLYESMCSPGADVDAVWYRASMLGLLEMLLPNVAPQMFPESPLTPWTHNGELDDAVFQVAATFPMKNMEVGVVHNELPFDLEEFLKQIGART